MLNGWYKIGNIPAHFGHRLIHFEHTINKDINSGLEKKEFLIDIEYLYALRAIVCLQ